MQHILDVCKAQKSLRSTIKCYRKRRQYISICTHCPIIMELITDGSRSRRTHWHWCRFISCFLISPWHIWMAETHFRYLGGNSHFPKFDKCQTLAAVPAQMRQDNCFRETVQRMQSFPANGAMSYWFTYGTHVDKLSYIPAADCNIVNYCWPQARELCTCHEVKNWASSGWLQSLLFLSRFRTIKKCDEIKYVYLIPSSNDTWHVIWFYLHPTPW